ncbi:hypothetical protein PENTCL1PPCAC_21051 [Pristionchus entomophagus]|uniref:C-type lectin domain-containing protein n=1 Tax=Pristionchus entomophagus TaxID=358040 RepID=A0AAV5TX77_9BILA|nr:hypothetical protein PENTCL1PPCAC_21051 [Pristionchus entomophagus]
MRALLCFAFFTVAIAAPTCPAQYQMKEDRCIRPLVLWQNDAYQNVYHQAKGECSKDGAHLPIVRSKEDNDALNRIANSFDEINGWNIFLVLDLVCNGWTHRLEWADGTSLDWTPSGVDLSFDCVDKVSVTAISKPKQNDWALVKLDDTFSYTALCEI